MRTRRARTSSQYYNPSPGVVAKRQRIKRVAARLFAERGLAAVGLTQVSHAMNLPSGSVKYDFRNRDDVLADILADHEVALSQRVGAAYDATAKAGPVARLAALVEAFYRSVLAAADAHRALLFSTALLPAEPQAWVRARYRALLDSFAETLAELAPEVPAGAVADILVPTLERLLSGVVLWNVPGEHDADPHYPRMVTAMMVAATRTITAEALAERAAAVRARVAGGAFAGGRAGEVGAELRRPCRGKLRRKDRAARGSGGATVDRQQGRAEEFRRAVGSGRGRCRVRHHLPRLAGRPARTGARRGRHGAARITPPRSKPIAHRAVASPERQAETSVGGAGTTRTRRAASSCVPHAGLREIWRTAGLIALHGGPARRVADWYFVLGGFVSLDDCAVAGDRQVGAALPGAARWCAEPPPGLHVAALVSGFAVARRGELSSDRDAVAAGVATPGTCRHGRADPLGFTPADSGDHP